MLSIHLTHPFLALFLLLLLLLLLLKALLLLYDITSKTSFDNIRVSLGAAL